ncbi:UDP-N-acetylmuramoyl-L-alanine--D-glutamate ligase [Segniliparus rugosus]|uniref:UDP-N-acetylmuramoylalanine--D-glutamate ligase n=1 Tax=Segniliparus rugosus (strain ATCC BAA-974 / DSM 45345 / CCUG 50838 / CIP 108380 / JCM 13579 / CDC 945) TaxID=679197 RepID=U1M208_SEGRC|nr:UDP-N-acetylmuramoyl-L-alanine--D-glutamate ligase [Segniliparus rugosus]ERG69402.1 UDP-N-acetylmuramoylalanine-D-glutamate ligase [Segniliparus rugosus ATCC BAA-974]
MPEAGSVSAGDRLAGKRALVVGAGVAGLACAEALRSVGARVLVSDLAEGAADLVEAEALALVPEQDLVVVSPGVRPQAAIPSAAARAGVPVWGDAELAWRIDGGARRWLAVTGTNGKTTTTSMLEAILLAAGEPAVACGNIGHPVASAVLGPARTLAVELSSFQLSRAPSLSPLAGVVLNIAEDHIDWHGSMAAYVEAKARALGGQNGVVNLDDEICAGLAVPGRRIGFRLGAPGPGELGVCDGVLVDRVDWAGGAPDPVEILPAAEIRPSGPAGVVDALAAAALARAWGASAETVAAGLRGFAPGAHRGEVVAERGGVEYRDDSKATNPHAALNAIEAHRSVVWLAGGQLKGAQIDDLVVRVAARLRAAVLFGHDRDIVADALRRHAPHVPIVVLETRDDGSMFDDPAELMRAAVSHAARYAGAGDVVLLAPAAASLDQFSGYAQRGNLFAEAARGALSG